MKKVKTIVTAVKSEKFVAVFFIFFKKVNAESVLFILISKMKLNQCLVIGFL